MLGLVLTLVVQPVLDVGELCVEILCGLCVQRASDKSARWKSGRRTAGQGWDLVVKVFTNGVELVAHVIDVLLQ